MTAINDFRVMQRSLIFPLFFRNRVQCIVLYQLHNSQALLNLRGGYLDYKINVVNSTFRMHFTLISHWIVLCKMNAAGGFVNENCFK